MVYLLAATQAAAAAAAPATAPATVAAAPVAVPMQSMSAAEVASYIDPRDIASFMPPPPPTTEFVAVSDSFFRLMENITMVTLFVIGFFLLAPLIEKLNKPYEHLGPWGGNTATANSGSTEDRNALVLLAIGFAIAGFGLIQGREELIRVSAGAALFPIFVGIALLVRRRLARAAAAEERAAAQG
jgi:hypothetical protein